MKNDAIAVHGSDGLPAPWRDALTLFDHDLRRRGTAERTRRVYGIDLDQLAALGGAIHARSGRTSTTRRCAATPPSSPSAGSRRARPRASSPRCAQFFRVLVEHGVIEANPADLLASPKRPQPLPRALKPADVAALLDRIPTTTPLELRDRALFEVAYGCGLRAEELVYLDLDVARLRRGAAARRGQGRQDPLRARRRARAAPRVRRYLERAPAGAGRRHGEPALFLSKTGRRLSTSDVRRRLRAWARQRRGTGRGAPARPPALVRDPSAGGRRRSARHPGAARPRDHLDDPGLHSGRVSAPAGSVRTKPPPG